LQYKVLCIIRMGKTDRCSGPELGEAMINNERT
jgi:hypothetical protein